MSMKRNKPVSRGRDREAEEGTSPFASSKPAVQTWNWKENVSAKPADDFAPYSLGATFQRGAFVVHPKFGKGVVTNVEPQRIEVLFEDGAKKLGHGQP